jgi:hypothetical protein
MVKKDVQTKQYIQWSILQHYEVCNTPLLDFTHSLHVACSFAQIDNDGEFGYVYVFGLPYITNRISYNSEQDIVNIRLLSICPPQAFRPYFQEGYLAGTMDVTHYYAEKTPLDFSCRLIAKFSFPVKADFWDNATYLGKELLYPEVDDIKDICKSIQIGLPTEMHPGLIGEFITEWVKLEQYLISRGNKYSQRVLSIRQAIVVLTKYDEFIERNIYVIDSLRKFRNELVHNPRKIEIDEIRKRKSVLDNLISQLNI